MIWARRAGVMGVPMKWEIARIFVVGTGGSGFCAEAALSGVIGFFMAVAPYSSLGILLLIVSVFDAKSLALWSSCPKAFKFTSAPKNKSSDGIVTCLYATRFPILPKSKLVPKPLFYSCYPRQEDVVRDANRWRPAKSSRSGRAQSVERADDARPIFSR